MKEKPSTFFFIKGEMTVSYARTFQEKRCFITTCIASDGFECGKPGGKSGKPCGKLPFFFTKTVENPVEKVKRFCSGLPNTHFTVELLRLKSRMNAVPF